MKKIVVSHWQRYWWDVKSPACHLISYVKERVSLSSSHTPMPVEYPGTFLTLLAAVFCSSASPAFGELSCELFPFPALVICTLSNAATRIILAAQIPHYYPSPVLHILTVMANSELFDQRENIKVVRQHILLFLRVAG